MADFNNAVMTNGGAALLAATTAGTAKIKFTKLVTGSGTYSDSEKTRASLQARSTLKAQKQEIPFSKIEMATNTCVKLTALVSNAELSTGYYVNEIGIYAVDELHPAAAPVLYSIAIANVADYLPPYNGLTPSTITQEYFATVDNALEVTIQTKTGAVALAEDLEATNEELARAMSDNDRLYAGRDLTTVFALEIAKYSDAWAWIKANGRYIRGYGVPKYSSKATSAGSGSGNGGGLKYSKGDIVNFTGSKHYASANATSGPSCKAGKAKVTNTAEGTKHPYHLIAVNGSGSTVYGWVNASDIAGASTAAASGSIEEGKTVKVKTSATKYATGQTIPSWVKSRKYTVQKIDGDRALLKEITSWVKVSDLELA